MSETSNGQPAMSGGFIETPEQLRKYCERACEEGMNGARMVVILSFDGKGRAWAGRSFLQNVVTLDKDR